MEKLFSSPQKQGMNSLQSAKNPNALQALGRKKI
jgi:hypothetical protein